MNKRNKKVVFVAMSGGVDSSVAALLLKNQGYDAVGVFMRCFNLDGCAEKDAEDGRRVAEKLGIPFYVWDFEAEYKKRVVEYMIDGYRRGFTPNPDVMCNKEIKFGLFLERALTMGADYVATGHYARRSSFLGTGVVPTPAVGTRLHLGAAIRFGRNQAHRTSDSFPKMNSASYSLFEAKDKSKDQSYFLWTLTREQVKHCLFPIGDYLKSEVREIARKAGLPTADKKDSQGICFLGKVTLADFLKEYIPERRGEVLTTSGNKIGEHSGAHFYTIGQRHLGVNFQFSRSNFQAREDRRPFYLAEKDVKTNTVVVAEGNEHPALYKKEINLVNVNFISSEHSHILQNVRMLKVLARVRYRQPLQAASVLLKCDKRHEKKSISHLICRSVLKFDQPVKFVAPGQSAVLYSVGGELLGGGVIV